MAYEHVLAVTDGSREADRAVETASELAREHRARLTLAAVVELERPWRHCASWSNSWNEVLRDAARADLRRAWRRVEVPADLEILYGKPSEAVAKGARTLGCDLIVVPRHAHRIGRVLHRDPTPALRRLVECEVIQPD